MTMHRNPVHLPDEELLLFAEGELPLRRTAWARQHLSECGRCRARGEELEATLRDFVRLHETQTDSRESVRRGLRASVSAELSKAATQKGKWRFRFSRVSLAHQLACACVAIIHVAGGAWLLRGFAFQQPIGHLLRVSNNPLPVMGLTPGATRAVSLESICNLQEPEANLPVDASLERQVFSEYGLPLSSRGAYEVDYLITPELGGATDIRNLWPEPYATTDWNAHVKDALESRLHELVCQGKMQLSTAQNEIATDWIGAYKKHFHTDRPQQSPSADSSSSMVRESQRAKYSEPRQTIYRQYLSAILR
jgi:anti-sigma factor RsiW